MFANSYGCDEKMSIGIEIIGFHNGKEILEKQLKNNVLRFVKCLTSNLNKSSIFNLFVKL